MTSQLAVKSCVTGSYLAKHPEMRAKSIKGVSTVEITEALQDSMADGFKPSLSFVFSSVKQDFAAISEVLGKQDVTVFGATTSGEFIDGDVGEGSAAILLLDMDPAFFELLFVDSGTPDTREIEGVRSTFNVPMAGFFNATGRKN